MAEAEKAGWILVGFLSSILVLGYGAWFYAFILGILVLFFYPKPTLFLIPGFLLGILYCSLYSGVSRVYEVLPQNSKFEAVIISGSKRSGNYYKVTARLRPPYRGKFSMITKEALEYGKLVELKGEILGGNIRERPLLLFPGVKVVESDKGNAFGEILNSLKVSFLAPLELGLPVSHSAFLKGLLSGDTSDFSTEFRSEMRRSGTTHLVALSGYNIALVATAIAWVFGRFLSPRWMFITATISISAFVLMTGAEPSVLRAGIMGIMLLLARSLGRIYSFGHAVLWTAFCLVLVQPAIIFSLGFQLSFVSLLGIAYLPLLFQRIFHLGTIEGIKGEVVTAASAYFASLPLTVSLGGIPQRLFQPT